MHLRDMNNERNIHKGMVTAAGCCWKNIIYVKCESSFYYNFAESSSNHIILTSNAKRKCNTPNGNTAHTHTHTLLKTYQLKYTYFFFHPLCSSFGSKRFYTVFSFDDSLQLLYGAGHVFRNSCEKSRNIKSLKRKIEAVGGCVCLCVCSFSFPTDEKRTTFTSYAPIKMHINDTFIHFLTFTHQTLNFHYSLCSSIMCNV